MWKIKNSISPKPREPPMAKEDKAGNLITGPGPAMNLYLETYKERLQHKEIGEDLKELKELKEELQQ